MLGPRPYIEVKEILNSIPIREHQVFLKLTYATMGRVGEIVRGKYKKNPPISSDDLEIDEKRLTISVLTEKVYKHRRVLISRKNESWLTEPIIAFSKELPGELFPYSTRWGEKVFEKYFDSQKIHSLRAWRATHLLQGKVTGKPLPFQVVRRMGGWTDTAALSKLYDFSVIEDYEDLILGGNKDDAIEGLG